MKKYILMSLAALLSLSFTSCREENGTEPGNDGNGVTTVFTYVVDAPYNSDNDVAVRFAGNAQVSEIYYLVEKEADFDKNYAEKGEAAYMDYVMQSGSKVELNKDVKEALNTSDADVVLTNLIGSNVIAAVSVSANGTKTFAKGTFVGLEWEDVTDGYYQFGSASALPDVSGLKGVMCSLQHCTTAGKTNLYRLVDVFGKGFNLKFSVMEDTKTMTQYGNMWYVRVANQPTSWEFKTYGTLNVRDIAYWQGNDAFATNASYGCTMYDDYYTEFCLQYNVTAGNVGYATSGAADVFLPSSYLE